MADPSASELMFGDGWIHQLLRAAKAGDALSFDRLITSHQQRVIRLAQRLLMNREAAKDAAQDVFLRLYKNLHRMRDDRNIGAWLYTATCNVCFDIMRRSKGDLPLDLVRERSDDHPDPENAVLGQQRKELILAALAELSPRERQAIVLHDLEGVSTTEVANIMAITEATVRSHVSSGRVKMKNFVVTRLRRQA